MMREDEGRQVKPGLRGAGDEDSPAKARAAQAEHDKEAHAEEGGMAGVGKGRGSHGDGSAMARSPGAAKSATSKDQGEQKSEMSGGSEDHGMAGKSVESHAVMGGNETVHAKGAEEKTDNASSKANRKENEEPEREAAEKRAIGRTEVRHSGTAGDGHTGYVPAKNVMGSGPGGPAKASYTI